MMPRRPAYADITRGDNGSIDRIAKTRFLSAYYRAVLHFELGENDIAFALLEAAMRAGEWYCKFARHDQNVDLARSDPRFEALMTKYRPPDVAI
jgi:hypothetical protein